MQNGVHHNCNRAMNCDMNEDIRALGTGSHCIPAEISKVWHGLGLNARLGGAVLILALMFSLTGCGDRGPKGFINPSELTSRRHQPLLKPILSTLGTTFDMEQQEFATATSVRPDDLKANMDDYVIGRNDLIQVSITELVGPGIETLKQVRVSESGNISLPYINAIKAIGLTEAQLEQAIANEYKSRNIIANAQVSATVIEARGRVFSILGSVGRAGQFSIVTADFRVLDALTLAGDVTVANTDNLYIIRPARPGVATSQPAASGTTGDLPQAPRPTVNQPDVFEPRMAPAPASGPTSNPAGLTDGSGPLTPPVAPLSDDRPTGAYISQGGNAATWTGGSSGGNVAGTLPGTLPSELGGSAVGPGPAVYNPATAAANGTASPFEFSEPPAPTDSRIIRIPLSKLRDGDLRYNAVIRPNDTILVPVPKVSRYFVGAHVARPGVYDMTNQKITLKQAIISAGMLDELAIPQRTDVIRRVNENEEVYVRVDLSKVFDGTQPDIFLKPNDTIMVGTNFGAPFVAALRNAFRITYGFGFLYDRNYSNYTNKRGVTSGL